jgi:ribosomal-protein-alanine N-acetyltransferase
MELIPIPPEGMPAVRLLTVSVPAAEWISGNQTFYKVVGFNPPWIAYLAAQNDVIVGTCAFKGKPKDGIVEIAYGTHAGHEGRGIATRMASRLVGIAQATDPAVRIIAQTLPEHNASTRVLTKCD